MIDALAVCEHSTIPARGGNAQPSFKRCRWRLFLLISRSRSEPSHGPSPTSPPTSASAPDELDLYGKYKAKSRLEVSERPARGRLVLVTAISPTAAGEGKSTTSVGPHAGAEAGGANAALCMREPSLGPVFGVKGGAAGGGLLAGDPDGGHQPPLHRRFPRHLQRARAAGGDARQLAAARQPDSSSIRDASPGRARST